MLEKKMLMIVNPVAGKGKAKENVLKLVSMFSAAHYTVTVYPTTSSKEKTIKYLSSNAHKYDVVVCCGGDGTFSQTVNGLTRYENPPKLGYIPLGSTNDIAKTYGIPLDPVKCAKKIIQGKSEKFDVGLFNLRPFSYVAAAGAFANVSYSTSTEMKNKIGHLAYILEGIKEVPNIKPKKIHVEFDGNVIEDDVIYVSFSNTVSIGGVFNLNSVNTNDGLFELTLVKAPGGLIDTAEIIKHAVKSDFSEGPIRIYHTSSVTVKTSEELDWTLDGENGGRCRKAVIKNIPQAIDLIR